MVSALFSSLTLYPAGDTIAQQHKVVTVGAVTRSTVADKVAIIGNLVAKEEIRINALIESKEIREILVEVGDIVSKGQPLATIDAAEATMQLDKNTVQLSRAGAAVAQEKSRVEVAEVVEREARKVLERTQSLIGKGAVSQQLYDEHENAFARAKAQLELSHLSLMVAEADRKLMERERAEIALTIERSTVRATEAGRILSRSARIGALTSSSGEPLFVIAKDGLIEMEAGVSETSFVKLKEGMLADVNVPGMKGAIKGSVRLSAAQIDQATRMGSVRLMLPQGPALVPGAFLHGWVEVGQRLNVTVPATAVRSKNGEISVFVVENGHAILRPVRLGSSVGDAVEVVSGVDEGEIVVTKSGSFLKHNEKVEAVQSSGTQLDELSSAEIVGSVAR